MAALLLACIDGYAQASFAPRVNFNQRLEPDDKVLHGFGQGANMGWMKEYLGVMDATTQPFFYMQYTGVGDIRNNLNTAKNEIAQIEKPGQYYVLQLGMYLDTYTENGAKKGPVVPSDAQVTNFAKALKEYGRPVYIRIGHEFNGFWTYNTNKEDYKLTFRKIYNALRAEGADNVATVWCADPGWFQNAEAWPWFPGAEYIDWFGVDLFSVNSITSPLTIQFLDSAVHYRKPVFIGEAAPKDIGVNDGQADWDAWFKPYFDLIRTRPEIKASSYISWNWPTFDAWKTWKDSRINTNAVVAANYYNEMKSPLYQHNLGEQAVRELLKINTPFVSLNNTSSYFISPGAVTITPQLGSRYPIAKVEYFNGTTKLGETTSSPFTFTWPDVATGTYTITAKATDQAGNESTSFEKVITVETIRSADNPQNTINGLQYEFYFVEYLDAVPDFEALTPTKQGIVGTFSLAPRTRDDLFAMRFRGYIDVPADGIYTFYLSSDDGSKLYIGDKLVVNHDGHHNAYSEKTGQIGLTAGKHAITVGYFEGNQDNILNVKYAGPGITKRTVPVSALYFVPGNITYRAPENPANTENGLDYTYYEGTWYSVPNFAALTPVKQGGVANFDISVRNRNDNFAIKYTGFLQVPTDGIYYFYASSDDGSRISIGDEVVVDNVTDTKEEKGGMIALKAGKHAITVAYLEVGGGEFVNISYAGPSIPKTLIPASALYRPSLVNVNLALNKPATASGVCNANEKPEKAVDTNAYSKWCHNTTGAKWLKVDLGQVYTLTKWVVRHAGASWEPAGRNTKDFALQVSNSDASDAVWTDVDVVTGNTDNITSRNITVSATGRYVRLYITNSGEDAAARIYNLEIYGNRPAGRVGVAAKEMANEEHPLTVYPNPVASGPVTVRYYSEAATEVLIEVVDGLGNRHLLEKHGAAAGYNEVTLKNNPLPSGLYYVKVAAGKQPLVSKLIVQH